jgi:rhizosphere induced protein
MSQKTIIFTNNSDHGGSFCIFQQHPNPGTSALAWFVKFANPGTMVYFSWDDTDYCFIWKETGPLIPGQKSEASQFLPAAPYDNNVVTLTKSNGGYQFIDQTSGGQPGMLTVRTDQTVLVNQASVGVGMSGSGTFAVQTLPQMIFTFEPHAEYWLAFGDFQQGQAFDTSTISNPFQIIFPPNISTMRVALDMNNSWAVRPVNN